MSSRGRRGGSAAAAAATAPHLAAGPRADWNGYWVLDRHRSEALNPHLDALGMHENALIAAEKVDVAYKIAYDGGAGPFVLRHVSTLGEKERRFMHGEEHREATRDGSPVRMVMDLFSSAPNAVVNVIDWHRGRITDTRTLIDGGATIEQTIDFTHKGYGAAGKRTITKRYFVRGPPAA